MFNGLPLSRLRWNGSEVIDAGQITNWYVDSAGYKRLSPAPDRYPVTCSWDAVLVREGNQWRVKAAAEELIEYANIVQWKKALAGVMIPVGDSVIVVPTDTTALALLSGAVARAEKPNPPEYISWQAGPTTFVNLTPAQVVAIGVAVADFMQATFDTLQVVINGILSGAITSKEQIDSANWPI
jgi:hypothetical protein